MLTLKTKSVRFEWADDDVESVVTLSSDDDQDALLRKLKRVIALVEGEQRSEEVFYPNAGVPKYADAPAPQTGNGWAAVYGPPELPEDRKGDWELVQSGEGE